MSKLKKYIILISCAVVGLFHLYSLISGQNFYPVSQYNMFSFLKKIPVHQSSYLYALDSHGQEIPFILNEGFFFRPYNQRGFYNALKETISDQNYHVALHSLAVRANKIDPKISGLRLYDIVCSCGDFAKSGISSVDDYIKERCKKNLREEALLE